jgi:hypothetical protein
MNSEKTKTATAKEQQPVFVKTIGKTAYMVKVHFSKTSKETMPDKIMRLLTNEASQK